MLRSFRFPTLTAYYKLLLAFQEGLLPKCPALFSTLEAASEARNFRFATAFSQNPTLSVAVVECVNQVQRKLGEGVPPDFCQLFVTSEPYGKHVSLAPRFVQEIFGTYGVRPPVLIGGAVEGIVGWKLPNALQAAPQQPHIPAAQGVSLLAAVLPGVKLHPFSTRGSGLPDVAWEDLLQVGTPGPQEDHSAAALLLCEPHYSQVPQLLERLQAVLPAMPVVGGVLRQGAWGREYRRERSMRGALFVGNETVDDGAVGCILTGPVQIDSICAQGCRPVGPRLEVTNVLRDPHHNYIMELDHQPACLVLQKTHEEHLSARDRLLGLQIGVSADGGVAGASDNDNKQGGYVCVAPAVGRQGSLDVGEIDVAVGSTLQLHVQDGRWAQRRMQQQLQKYLETVSDAGGDASALGALLYSCTGVSHNEPMALESAMGGGLPDFAFQGAKVQGEIGSTASEGPTDGSLPFSSSRLQTYCSSFGFLRRKDLVP